MKVTKGDCIVWAVLALVVLGTSLYKPTPKTPPPIRTIAGTVVTEEDFARFTVARRLAEKFQGEWKVLKVDMTVGLGYFRTVHLVLGDGSNSSTRVLLEVQGEFSLPETSQLFQKVVLAIPGDRVRLALKEPGKVELMGPNFLQHLEYIFVQ